MLTGSVSAIHFGPHGGAIGLDLPALLHLAVCLGYDQSLLARLLPFAERGMIAAFDKAHSRN